MNREKIRQTIRKIWEYDRGKYITLTVCALLLLLLRLCMYSRAACNFIVHNIVQPYQRMMGFLCGFVPFSVAELFWAAVIVFCIVYVLRTADRLLRGKQKRMALLWRCLLTLACVALTIYTGFTLLWGLTYYADTLEESIGIKARPISVDELEKTTRIFVEKINAAAPLTEHIAPGMLSGDKTAIIRASDTVYDQLEQQIPFLDHPAVRPKPVFFSRIMSHARFTGFFFPFTGEANLNMDSPECMLPSTIAHELSHVRGVAAEQTANFAAILACDTCGDPMYAYSGALLGYIHLSNALYSASPERWKEAAQGLCEQAREDLAANNAYWRQFETPVSGAVQSTYSGFLKSYDQELGLKSYGAVVDLLVAYYAGSEN